MWPIPWELIGFSIIVIVDLTFLYKVLLPAVPRSLVAWISSPDGKAFAKELLGGALEAVDEQPAQLSSATVPAQVGIPTPMASSAPVIATQSAVQSTGMRGNSDPVEMGQASGEVRAAKAMRVEMVTSFIRQLVPILGPQEAKGIAKQAVKYPDIAIRILVPLAAKRGIQLNNEQIKSIYDFLKGDEEDMLTYIAPQQEANQ